MKIRVNSHIEKVLYDNKIHFHYQGAKRLRQGDVIVINNNCKIEPYTAFNAGLNLHSMGAFSYSNSVLPLPFVVELTIGRYCSIAVLQKGSIFRVSIILLIDSLHHQCHMMPMPLLFLKR